MKGESFHLKEEVEEELKVVRYLKRTRERENFFLPFLLFLFFNRERREKITHIQIACKNLHKISRIPLQQTYSLFTYTNLLLRSFLLFPNITTTIQILQPTSKYRI